MTGAVAVGWSAIMHPYSGSREWTGSGARLCPCDQALPPKYSATFLNFAAPCKCLNTRAYWGHFSSYNHFILRKTIWMSNNSVMMAMEGTTSQACVCICLEYWVHNTILLVPQHGSSRHWPRWTKVSRGLRGLVDHSPAPKSSSSHSRQTLSPPEDLIYQGLFLCPRWVPG